MSFDLSQMKRIDQSIKNIVFGFIRNAQNLFPYRDNPYFNIPPLIGYICIFYYCHIEYFSKYGTKIILDGTERSITHNDKHEFGGQTAFGNIEITKNNIFNKYIWTFQVIMIQKTNDDYDLGYIVPGIDASHKRFTEYEFHDDQFDDNDALNDKRLCYAFELYGDDCFLYCKEDIVQSKYDKYGVQKGDIIKIELNIINKELKYYRNNEEKCGFTNIAFDDGETYTMAVAIYHATLKIKDFSRCIM